MLETDVLSPLWTSRKRYRLAAKGAWRNTRPDRFDAHSLRIRTSSPFDIRHRTAAILRVAFFHHGAESGFITADHLALSRHFDVVRVSYPGWPSPRYVRETILAAFRCDAAYAFFASEHALLPAVAFRLMRKKVVIAAGGYDVANLPERRYGLSATHRGWLPNACIRLATAVIAHTKVALEDVLRMVPSASQRTVDCPLALDPNVWADEVAVVRRHQVVTVGFFDEDSFSRKGLDRFLAAARADPDTSYVVAGKITDAAAALLSFPLPANVRAEGFLPLVDLKALLWSSAAYAQLSWHESFGMAVVEAMSCGCTPVTSTDPALKEVCGDWAVVSTGPSEDIAAVRKAIFGEIDRKKMRDDTLRRYSLAQREAALYSALTDSQVPPTTKD